MGYHQGDDLDDYLRNNGSYAGDYYPSGRLSSAGRSSLAGDTSARGSQPLGNVYQFDARGSQYRDANPFLPNGAKDNLPDAQPGANFAQGYPQADFFPESTQDVQLPGSSFKTPGFSQGFSSYYGTALPEPKPFGEAAGTQDDSHSWLFNVSPIAMGDVMSTLGTCREDDSQAPNGHGTPTRRRPSVSIASYQSPLPKPSSTDSQASFKDRSSDAALPKRLLACPFHRHSPRKHCRGACRGPGFSDISRLKEHLYRKHAEPENTCPRCLKSFETSDLLRSHQRKRPCEVMPEGDHPDWMTAAQKSEVRSKKRTKDSQTDEEKWARIYGILFGWDTSDIPSPYYDDGQADEVDHEECYRISYSDVDRLRTHDPPYDLKCRFESSVGRVLGSASGPQLKKISDLACDLVVEFMERCAL